MFKTFRICLNKVPMKIQLSKKNKIIVITLLVLVLGGTGGYLLWRVNQDDTVAPTDSEAGCSNQCIETNQVTNFTQSGSCPENLSQYTVGVIGGVTYYNCCTYVRTCDASCGDGSCDSGETASNCPSDCTTCGDNLCTGAETLASCPGDCSVCGDNVCTANEETLASCPSDCSVCGDNVCTANEETLASCPNDCSVCGDNVCTANEETLASCPGDCSVCGDNICTTSEETVVSCPDDCSSCGDGKCTGTETAVSCASDCVCKVMAWTNKPTGAYKPDSVARFSSITITNPNSSSAEATGVTIKLSGSALSQCTSSVTGGSCFSVAAVSGKQVVTISLFRGQPTIAVGTYVISVTLPGTEDPCIESATFSIAEDAVPIEEVPVTGLLDGVMGKIYVGTGFVFLGVMTTQLPKFKYAFNTLGEKNRVVVEDRKRKKEEKKRNRFESKFK